MQHRTKIPCQIHSLILKQLMEVSMYSKITGEFEEVEFAEYAAKHIRDTIDSPKKIKIVQNKSKLKPFFKSSEYRNAASANIFYLLPTAVTSYNYITGQVSRPVDTLDIEEPLLNHSVTLIVQTEREYADKVAGILSSFGGVNIKKIIK